MLQWESDLPTSCYPPTHTMLRINAVLVITLIKGLFPTQMKY